MSKFNRASSESTSVINYDGGKSFRQTKESELAFAVITTFLEDSYYESKDDRMKRISKLVEEVAEKDPLFVAKLAVITRREFHMRSAFHLLVALLARNSKGNSIVKNVIKEGVERPDDILEIVAQFKKPIPNQIKKGVRLALGKFDAYQLAKYRGDDKEISMVDVFNLVHPKPSQENAEAWKKLMRGELKNTETWESKLSAGENKGEVFAELIKSRKIGYMALLRNLRNILQTGSDEAVSGAAEIISNAEQVKKSKQLPFRFLSAFEAIEGLKDEHSSTSFEKEIDRISVIRKALTQAVTHAVSNIPIMEGRTLILTDNSGSMRGDAGGSSAISAHSQRTTADIANLFAALYWLRADNTLVGVFGDNLITPKLDREKDVFDNFRIINDAGNRVGGGTETGIFTMLEQLIKEKKIVDRIIIFSDCQVGKSCEWYDIKGNRGGDFNKLFQQYRKIAPNVLTYSVQLKGYGNTLFSDGVVEVGGWSDKIFDLIQLVEKKEGIVKWIENYQILL